jgi:glycosyltransferase 2 family protein
VLKNKKLFFTFLKILVTFLIVVLLISRLGLKNIIETICSSSPKWLFFAVAVFLLSTFIGVFQWRILLKNRGIPLAFWRSLRLYLIGMFFNNFLLGGIIGDFLKVVSIKSQDGKGKAGLAATFLDRFAGLWAMSGFAVVGSIILFYHGSINSGKILTAVIALFGTFLLFVGIITFLICKPVQRLCFLLLDKVPFSGTVKVRNIISEMLIEAHDVHILFTVGILSVIIQFLRIGVHILVALSLGLVTIDNFQYFFIFVPIIAMLMTLPLPLGVREAFGGTLFTLAGFPEHAAYVMGFLATLVGIAASSIGGLFYIVDRTVYFKEKHEPTIDCNTTS